MQRAASADKMPSADPALTAGGVRRVKCRQVYFTRSAQDRKVFGSRPTAQTVLLVRSYLVARRVWSLYN